MTTVWPDITWRNRTVYPKKYAHGFVVLCFVVVMQSFIMNSHEVFFHIHQGCFAGTGAIVRLPQCQWSKPDGYGKISQCITTTKHSKAKTVCIFLGIYCRSSFSPFSRYAISEWYQRNDGNCSHTMINMMCPCMSMYMNTSPFQPNQPRFSCWRNVPPLSMELLLLTFGRLKFENG